MDSEKSCHNCERWGKGPGGECTPSFSGGHYYDRLTKLHCHHYRRKRVRSDADKRARL